ncbi:cytochrome P450 [Macrolepiota fuliginosa MF-IS2]|uniref:Cytochrome P450 n=1 Tax=Macrolepiota fuliginosa MF-IS2 TaxID=1400762 RepID=A0A9P5XHC4_9AGAR|nr:cytochrome P450 [Macrolepiota fuliginosa MF-IS2]
MDFTIHPYSLLLVSLAFAWWIQAYLKDRHANPRRLPRPPGPKGYPIIGSLLNAPMTFPWLEYDKWLKIFGDMVYFEILGQSFLVLGSPQRINDLFEKRGAIYSDRPRMIMAMDMLGWGYNFGLIPYGSWWRRHYRLFHDHYGADKLVKFQPTMLKTTRSFLRRLLSNPEGFLHHTRHLFISSIMEITYGIPVEDPHDPLITNAEIVLDAIIEAMVPGKFLVDMIPALQYVPEWFPGAGWKRRANYVKKVNRLVSWGPFNAVKENLERGTAVPSVAVSMIEGIENKPGLNRAEEEEIIMNASATAFAGGSDTTVIMVEAFFLAMIMYPEVQKKAQDELDAVLGGRLPDINDRTSLPYINALVKELLRWHLVTPLGVPHAIVQADEYDGFYIPKGTIVIGNSWSSITRSLLHDPDVFDEPMRLMPERYLKGGQLNPKVRDPWDFSFGYGRRVCPGRHIADMSLFVVITSVLTVFDIKPPLDDEGMPMEPKAEFTPYLISAPVPFQVRILPRSKKAEILIRDTELME